MKGLLETNGKTSSTRVAMLMCVATGCAVALMGVYSAAKPGATSDLTQVAFLSGALIASGLAGKVVQHGKEKVTKDA